jgi:hypothetical protein
MWLRVAILALFAAYVGYRLVVGLAIARARRRGDTHRVAALRRRARASVWVVIGVLAVAGLFLAGLVALNDR